MLHIAPEEMRQILSSGFSGIGFYAGWTWKQQRFYVHNIPKIYKDIFDIEIKHPLKDITPSSDLVVSAIYHTM